MWETLPLSRKRFLPVTQPWPGNLHRAAPDCLCPPGPSRPPWRGSAQLGSALAEGAQVPPETCPQSQAGGLATWCSALRTKSPRPREKPEPNQLCRLLPCLLRGPRGSLARSCLFRVVLYAYSPRWKPLPGCGQACLGAASQWRPGRPQVRPRVSSWVGRGRGLGVGRPAGHWVPRALGVPSLESVRRSVGRSLAHGGHHAGRVGVAEGEAGGGVDGRRGGQDVSGVAEGWQVAHRRHVPRQGGGAEGGGLVLHTPGQLLEALGPLLALLGLAGHLPVPGLDAFLLHGQRPVHLAGHAELSEAGAPFPARPQPQPGQGGPLRKAHRPPGPPHPPCQERRREATAPAHRPCRSPPTAGSASEQRSPAMGGVLQQAAPLVGSPSGARFPSQATLGPAAQAAHRSTQRSPGRGGARLTLCSL